MRFGIFEVILETGEVRRAGVKVKLQEQPFQVLAALLEKPGEIVTKEELQERIWKDDTFVDFDRSLATAINKVRQALDDSAMRPRYIETVAKRGYRFIGLEGLAPATEARPVGSDVDLEAELRKSLRLTRASAVVAAAALVLVLALFLGRYQPEPAEEITRRFSFEVEGALLEQPSISPDGLYIVYAAQANDRTSLWLRSLASDSVRELEGTEGAIFRPFWSPDSLWIGFATSSELRRIPVGGGRPTIICRLPPTGSFGYRGGTWNADGRIVFAADSGLYEVSASGGEARPVDARFPTPQDAESDQGDLGIPNFPHFLASEKGTSVIVDSRWLGNYDYEIEVLGLESRQRDRLREGFGAVPAEGHLVYGFDGGIWAMPFSLESLKASGEPFRIVASGTAPTVSLDGTLAYANQIDPVERLVWRTRQGTILEAVGRPQVNLREFSLAPDGTMVAVTADDSGTPDIWIQDLQQSTIERLTFDGGFEALPAWRADGSELMYLGGNEEGQSVWRIPRNGVGKPVAILSAGGAPDWSRDGRYVVSQRGDGKARETLSNIYYIDLKQDASQLRPILVVGTSGSETAPKLSPDGRLIAYVSDETGNQEIYVHSFPEGTLKRQVSVDGGTQPRWRADGREIFYVRNRTMMAVPVSTDQGFTAGQPQELFSSADLVSQTSWPEYDVSADGQRFLTSTPYFGEGAEPSRIRIVENWYEEFRERQK